jgi:hypothetical protein
MESRLGIDKELKKLLMRSFPLLRIANIRLDP